MRSRIWILIIAVGAAAGCAGPRTSEGGFDSLEPGSRLHAINRAGQQRDATALADLIESLESDDPAIRMMAIVALEQITGTRLGYDPYAPHGERQAAADEWLQSWRSGQIDAGAATTEP